MNKSMCTWCKRGPHKTHLGNCPALTGVRPVSRGNPAVVKKRTGAYLRRPRGMNGTEWLPHVLYLVETRPAPDSPAALYEEDNEI